MAAKETVDAIEKTIDVVEETLDAVERIPKVHLNGTTKRQQLIILGVTVAVSSIAGAVSGYFVAKKRLETKYAEISKQEIAEAKTFYSVLHKPDSPEAAAAALIPEENLKQAAEALKSYQGTDEEDPKKVEDAETAINIFSQPDDEFDYDEEVKKRTPERPYIITQEEYFLAEGGHEQVTITYYEGDDVLADERDQPVPEPDRVVGEDNLTRFGHGSKDKNIVYVRNERLGAEYEVVRSGGSFSREVLGFVEHSDGRRRRSHRRGDDG